MPSVFIGEQSSVYWFYKGFNLRSYAAWLVGVGLCIHGLANALKPGSVGQESTNIYNMTFILVSSNFEYNQRPTLTASPTSRLCRAGSCTTYFVESGQSKSIQEITSTNRRRGNTWPQLKVTSKMTCSFPITSWRRSFSRELISRKDLRLKTRKTWREEQLYEQCLWRRSDTIWRSVLYMM
jgi:hypothetical protein